jgi:uncharacterized protein (TIGR02246 family)
MHDIERTIERFCDAWNRHDVDALAALWAEDGELNHPWGTRSVGRAAVREALTNEHTGAMADSRLAVRSIDAATATPSPPTSTVSSRKSVRPTAAPTISTTVLPLCSSVPAKNGRSAR